MSNSLDLEKRIEILEAYNKAFEKDSILNYKKKKRARANWLSLEDLIDYLPSKKAKSTIYGWCSKGYIPHHKCGKNVMFLQQEIDSWLLKTKKKQKE